MQILAKDLDSALSYAAYSRYSEDLLETISRDTGNPMKEYARTNWRILQRLKRSVILTEELRRALSDSQEMIFVILTEGYCGDSAQTFPVFGLMQEKFPDKITIRVVLRDEQPELAALFFHTRAIPRLICLDKQSLKERFSWGNRPAPAQALMDALKTQRATPNEKAIALHEWYAHDKTMTLQQELTRLLSDQKEHREIFPQPDT